MIMPLWFGHGKKIENLESSVGEIKSQIGTVDGKIDKVLDELTENPIETDEPNGEVEPLPQDSTGESYTTKLGAIEREIVTCRDPVRLEELIEMEKRTRGWYNSRQKARLQRIHGPRNPYGRTGAPRYENNGDMGEERIGEVAQEIGISPEGKLDPGKLYHTLSGLISKNRTAANMLAKMAGIDNLDEAMKMFGQVISDPAKTAELGTLVGSGLTGVVKGAIDKFGSMKAPPTQGPPQQGPPAGQASNALGPMRTTDGFPLFAVGGKMVDPRNPYPVAG
jgi:hypothetical protein